MISHGKNSSALFQSRNYTSNRCVQTVCFLYFFPQVSHEVPDSSYYIPRPESRAARYCGREEKKNSSISGEKIISKRDAQRGQVCVCVCSSLLQSLAHNRCWSLAGEFSGAYLFLFSLARSRPTSDRLRCR